MHFGDYTFIFLLALVLFGPKKLPEIGRQLGKLLAEFRRASNEFKFQIQDELRTMEEEERRKKAAEQEAARAAAADGTAPAETALPVSTGPTILPPSIGESVSASKPFATAATVEPAGGSSAPPETEVDPSAPVDSSLPTETGAATVAGADELENTLEPPAQFDLTKPEVSESTNGAHPAAQEATAHHD